MNMTIEALRTFGLSVVLTAGVLCTGVSHAATAPPTPEIADCWSESGQDLADGQFMVNLNAKKISKANLIAILSGLSGVNISPVGYPLIFGDQIFVLVEAVDQSRPMMSRTELKATVQAELLKVLGLSGGTSASCNFTSYPAPAVGVIH